MLAKELRQTGARAREGARPGPEAEAPRRAGRAGARRDQGQRDLEGRPGRGRGAVADPAPGPQVTSVLLATFSLMPEGEPDGHHLTAALAERGIDSTWVLLGRPGCRLGGRRHRGRAVDLGLPASLCGVPRLGARDRAGHPPAQRRRGVRLERRQGLPDRARRRRRRRTDRPARQRHPGHRPAGGRRPLGHHGHQAAHRRRRGRRGDRREPRGRTSGRAHRGALDRPAPGGVGAHHRRDLGLRARRPGRLPGRQEHGRRRDPGPRVPRRQQSRRRPWVPSRPPWPRPLCGPR